MNEPTANRTITPSGRSKTTRMHLLKTLKQPGNETLASEMFASILINGAEYCRAHLLSRCHLCEKDYGGYSRECLEEERQELGLLPGGDRRVDRFNEKWGSRVEDAQFLNMLQLDIACMQHGPNHFQENPHLLNGHAQKLKAEERNINDSFFIELKELKEQGASQCCYWACDNPNFGEKLFTCAGCKFNKYCCKEHQSLDWTWEHRAECAATVPKHVLAEIEAKMKRHLAGDYQCA